MVLFPRLYGITTLQTFIYFQKYQNDDSSLKLMVRPRSYQNARHRSVKQLEFRLRASGESSAKALVRQTDVLNKRHLFRVLETCHTAFCMQLIYAYLITHFGEAEYFLNINWCVYRSPSRVLSQSYRRFIRGCVGASV